MTTNKPEVVGYLYNGTRLGDQFERERFDHYWRVPYSKSDHDYIKGVPLVRLADYEALQAECEKLRKDADRYRWLREQHNGPLDLVIATVGSWSLESWSGDDPDAAIDDAMQESHQ